MIGELLQNLCSVESTSGREEAILNYLNFFLEKANFTTKKQKIFGNSYNLIASRGSGGIWLIAHMDVYPKYEGNIRFTRVNGFYQGRGVVDVKGQIAALLNALLHTSAPVQVAFVVDEELGGRGSEALEVPENIIGAIVLEPTNLKLGIAEAGSLTIEAGFKGVSAHGAMPWAGVSAIELAIESYIDLKKQPFLKHRHPLFEYGGWVNIGTIYGGCDTMVVAPYCKIEVEIGFAPGLLSECVIKQVNEVFKNADFVHFLDISDPWETSPDELIVKRLKEVYEDVVGEKLKFCGMPAWTDASNLRKKGVPVVVFGAGNLALAHTVKEKISVGELKTLSNTLKKLIQSFS